MMPKANMARSLPATMLRTADLEYDLPEAFIATRPVEPRDSARLMAVHRGNRDRLEHRHVRDLPEILRAGDLLVVNRSRVLPARFIGSRVDTGGRVEGLFVGLGPRSDEWVVMLKARRFRAGAPIEVLGRDGIASGVVLRMIARDEDDPSLWRVAVDSSRIADVGGAVRDGGSAGAIEILDRVGFTPLPPYIRARRKAVREDVADEEDRARYQTVYACEAGSVAAPTAGLHFTPDLLRRLADVGVATAEVTLHVGLGTFKPVETEFVEQHPMHAEWCSMPTETREAVLRTRAAGGRVIAVGTTAARTLEAHAAEGLSPRDEHSASPRREASCAVETRLLITPGYRWRWTDGLMTNFHLPRSTLMAMAASMLPGGASQLKRLYGEAISRGYRFYSYGDAMVIVD